MTTDHPNEEPAAPDASDVVTGPVGSASLRDPASSGPEGADLDRLQEIDVDAGVPDRAALLSTEASDRSSEPNTAIRQLEAILQNLTTYATPVLREIAARAAELAAKAGEAAGPVAHKAAGVTEEVGGRLAAKGHEIASGLRSERAAGPASGESARPDESTSLDGPSSS
jgi:hypothetical protein